ncbi:MAG TPA: FtsX-like permease family protein [Nocardioidaceae bacterium]|jgi:putative ABC transport system permease protein
MLITFRDMQWRARRLVLGLAAISLVLGMTALLGALHDGFLRETDRTITFFDADTWIVPTDVSGPFTANSPLRQTAVDAVRAEPGTEEVTPVAIFRHVVDGVGNGFTDVNVIAYQPDGVVAPATTSGRAPSRVGEAAVDVHLGVEVGDTLEIAGRRLTVVGQVRGLTYNGGTPTVLITLRDGQSIAFDGRRLASALVVRGNPEALPDGLAAMTPTQVRDDLRRPLSVATTAIGIVAGLLWLVAAGIAGMLSFLSGLDRHRDFAVYKAYGVSTHRLLTSMMSEGAIISLVAGGVALVLAYALIPLFPVSISLTGADCLRLVGLALVAGVASSMLSVRGVVRVDPAVAFTNS